MSGTLLCPVLSCMKGAHGASCPMHPEKLLPNTLASCVSASALVWRVLKPSSPICPVPIGTHPLCSLLVHLHPSVLHALAEAGGGFRHSWKSTKAAVLFQMSTAGFASKDSQSCQGSLGAFQEFLDSGPMVLGRDSMGLEASDQMGQMDKAGSQVCLEWAQEVQALVIKITFLLC